MCMADPSMLIKLKPRVAGQRDDGDFMYEGDEEDDGGNVGSSYASHRAAGTRRGGAKLQGVDARIGVDAMEDSAAEERLRRSAGGRARDVPSRRQQGTPRQGGGRYL